MAIGSIYRLEFWQELFQQKIVNVLHFRSNKLLDSEQNLAEAWDAHIPGNWAGAQSSALKYKLIRVHRADGGNDVVHELVPTTGAGLADANVYPNQLAGVMSVRSNTTNRRKNGRIYLAGMRDNGVTAEGRVPVVNVQAMAAVGGALLANFGSNPLTNDYTFGVYSRRKQPAEGGPVVEPMFTPAETIRVSPIFGVQRRRALGVGV